MDREDQVKFADDDDIIELPPQLPPKRGILPPSEDLESWMERVDAMPDPEWLVDGILEPKGLLLVVGPEKDGKKSFLVSAMALGLASGKDVGMFHTPSPKRVLYYNQEGAEKNTSYRLKGLMRGLGITHQDLGERLHWAQGGAVFPKESRHRKALIAKIRDEEFDVCVLDTLAKSYGGDENDSGAMGEFVSAVYEIQCAGAAVILIHHTGKASRENAATFDFTRGVRGSSALTASFDTAIASLIMNPAEDPNRMLIKTTGKNVEPLHYFANWKFSGATNDPNFSVGFSVEGGANPGLYPEVDGDDESLDLGKPNKWRNG